MIIDSKPKSNSLSLLSLLYISEVRDLFRKWREENVRKSKVVIDLWEQALQNKEHKLGDESECNVNKKKSALISLIIFYFSIVGFLVLEQVCIAAADVNRMDLIDRCLYSLNKEFPGSLRVKQLQVLKLELAEKLVFR